MIVNEFRSGSEHALCTVYCFPGLLVSRGGTGSGGTGSQIRGRAIEGSGAGPLFFYSIKPGSHVIAAVFSLLSCIYRVSTRSFRLTLATL